MKTSLLFSVAFLLYFQNNAQPFIHDFFPIGVCDVVSPDTILHKRSILKQEGIKQIIAHQESADKTSTITVYINKQGATEKLNYCTKSKKKDFNFCTYDTIVYDNNGRMLLERYGDLDMMFSQLSLEYLDGGKVKQTDINRREKEKFDTSARYRYYNEKGQLVRIEYVNSKYGWDKAFIFYNEDGFVDSIRHDAINELMIFKRVQKGKNKVITLEQGNGIHTWVMNFNGQWISKEWKPKNKSILSKGESKFYYNSDQTLAKVITKRNSKTICTVTYSYVK